jgi:DNA-binding LacI/PurR family transcriptional regulator
MLRKAVSIQDIAHLAGVSHTTVSRALHDSPLISAEVRVQIQQLAEELGYVPNAVAQSLRGQRSNTIGLVVTTIADPFVGRVVRGIEEVAQKFHFSVFLSESKNDLEEEVAVIENFHRRRVDGVIVAAALLDAQHEQRLSRLNVPTLLINQQAESNPEQFHTISVDDYTGAHQAVDHLLRLGHCQIGYLGAGNRPRSNRIRLQAYQEALTHAGVHPSERWAQIAPSERKYHSDDVCDGQAMLPELIKAGVTAVFCYNDMLAVGALLACHSLGIAVPGDLSLVGFDDIELAQFVTPALTTIHQPKLRLGHLAMEMLLALMEDRSVEDRVMPTQLVVRSSTRMKDEG